MIIQPYFNTGIACSLFQVMSAILFLLVNTKPKAYIVIEGPGPQAAVTLFALFAQLFYR